MNMKHENLGDECVREYKYIHLIWECICSRDARVYTYVHVHRSAYHKDSNAIKCP